MKKLFILVLSLFMVFPLVGETYKVIDIEGKVFYGTSQNELQIGDILNEDEVLNVRPQARVTLQIVDSVEKRTFKKPSNRITVKEAWISSAVGKGLKKQTIVKATNIAPPFLKALEKVLQLLLLEHLKPKKILIGQNK